MTVSWSKLNVDSPSSYGYWPIVTYEQIKLQAVFKRFEGMFAGWYSFVYWPLVGSASY